MNTGIACGLLAAVLFGASTPFAKILMGNIAPVMLAGLLYLGSGIGLLAWFGMRAATQAGQPSTGSRLVRRDWPWLGGAILSGGVAGPILLMSGLSRTPAATASLLLNLEGVLTALMAWFVFGENFDRRIVLGMALILGAGVLLSLGDGSEFALPWGAFAIAAACLCWAIDNNLTRKLSAGDAVQIAGIKGLIAGGVNLAIASALGFALPAAGSAFAALVLGFFGYGFSLVLFVVALRHLGAARTGAYFSLAPFVGAAISLLLFDDPAGILFWSAAVLMGAGLWLHVSEKHRHFHHHPAMSHAHRHAHDEHDEHHRHAHDFAWDGKEPHTHEHAHPPLDHVHEHFPDVHHRHPH